jgi:ech hydrogenase subunit F
MTKHPLKMTKTALEGLFRKPATVRYPLERKPVYAATRGHIAIEEAKCILCVLCDKKCPTGAIKVDRAGKTWAIDRLRCIQCGYCVDVCPKKCLAMETPYSEPVSARSMFTVAVPFTPPAPKAKPATPPSSPASDAKPTATEGA